MENEKNAYQILSECRKKNGITCEELSLKTRYDIKFFLQFEAGNTDFLPPTYFRLFVKEYAKYIGYPINQALQMFSDTREQPKENVKETPLENELMFSAIDNHNHQSFTFKKKHWTPNRISFAELLS